MLVVSNSHLINSEPQIWFLFSKNDQRSLGKPGQQTQLNRMKYERHLIHL